MRDDASGAMTTLDGGGIADTLPASGVTANSPAAGTAIATVAAPGAGVYRVRVVALANGAPVNQNNVELRAGARVLGRVLALNGAQSPAVFDRVTLAAGEAVSLNVNTAEPGVFGYAGQLHVTKLS